MSEPERKTGEEEERKTERKDRKMIIRQSFENMTPLPTLSADQVKAFIDGTTRTCTLLFIQRHPKPESGGGNPSQFNTGSSSSRGEIAF